MRRSFLVNEGLVNVIKAFIVFVCMVSLMDSMNKDVQANQVERKPAVLSEEEQYFETLKERRLQRYLSVKKKYGRRE